MRGIVAVDEEDVPLTIALMWDDEMAWIRFRRDAIDVALSQNEVRELAKTFRQCVEHFDTVKKEKK